MVDIKGVQSACRACRSIRGILSRRCLMNICSRFAAIIFILACLFLIAVRR
jgi:hypothetical protein